MAAQKVARKDLRSLHQDLMNWSSVLQQNEFASDPSGDHNVLSMSIHESIEKCTEQYRPLSMSFQQWQTEQNILDSKKISAENRRGSIHKMIMLLAFQIECASKLELETRTGSECGMHTGQDLNQHEIDELIFSPTKEKCSNENLNDPFSAKLDDILDIEEQNPAFTYPDTPSNSPLVDKIVDNDTAFAFKSSYQQIHYHSSSSSEIESTASSVSEGVNYSETDDKFPAPPANMISDEDTSVLQNCKATDSHSEWSHRATTKTQHQHTYKNIDSNLKEMDAFTTAEKVYIANELKVASITELPLKETVGQDNDYGSDINELQTESKTLMPVEETGIEDCVKNSLDISLNLSHSCSEESMSKREKIDRKLHATPNSPQNAINMPEVQYYSSGKSEEDLLESGDQEESIYHQFQFEEVEGDIKEFEYPSVGALPIITEEQRKFKVDSFPIVLDSDEYSCEDDSQDNSFTGQQREKYGSIHLEKDVFTHSSNNGFIHPDKSGSVQPEEYDVREEPKLQDLSPGGTNHEIEETVHNDIPTHNKLEEVTTCHEFVLVDKVSASPEVIVEEVTASPKVAVERFSASPEDTILKEVTASPKVVEEEATASPKVIVVEEVALNSTAVVCSAKSVLIEENTPQDNFFPCKEVLVQEMQNVPKESIEVYNKERKKGKTDSLHEIEDNVFAPDEELSEDAKLDRGPRIEIPFETVVVEKVSLTPLSSPLTKVCSEQSAFSQPPDNSREAIEDRRSETSDLYPLPTENQAVKVLSFSVLQDGQSKNDIGENDKFSSKDALASGSSDEEQGKYERKSSSSSCGAGSYTVNVTKYSTSDDQASESEPHASENLVTAETETHESEKLVVAETHQSKELKVAEPHKSESIVTETYKSKERMIAETYKSKKLVIAETHQSKKLTKSKSPAVSSASVVDLKKSDVKDSQSKISSRSREEDFAERSKLMFEEKKKLFESSHSAVIPEKKTVVHSGKVRSRMEKLLEEKKSPEKKSFSVGSMRAHRVVCPNPDTPSPTYAPNDQKSLAVFAARPFSVSSSKRGHVAAPTRKPFVTSSVEEKIKRFQPSSPPSQPPLQRKPKHSIKRLKIAGMEVDAGKSSGAICRSNPLPSELPPIPPLPDFSLIDEDTHQKSQCGASSKFNVDVDAAPPRPALPDFDTLNESFGAEDM